MEAIKASNDWPDLPLVGDAGSPKPAVSIKKPSAAMQKKLQVATCPAAAANQDCNPDHGISSNVDTGVESNGAPAESNDGTVGDDGDESLQKGLRLLVHSLADSSQAEMADDVETETSDDTIFKMWTDLAPEVFEHVASECEASGLVNDEMELKAEVFEATAKLTFKMMV